jgi:RimJ/RimL family protein N-acetyltransferase
VEIRRSTAEDLEGFWQCIDAVARERRFIGMVEAPPLAEGRAFIDQARADGMIQFIAVDRARVVGWCDITPLRWEGFRHSGRLGMGLLAGFRGRGLGTRLLVTALRAAEEAGLTRVELEVFASNHTAIRLYERHGFVVEGVKRGARVLDGMVDDLVCMALVGHIALRE